MTTRVESPTRIGTFVPSRSGHTRGTDLSGSLEGAGGIGGLLARSFDYSGGNWPHHDFYHADGGGNITYMINSAGRFAASYRYDPFGNLISSDGRSAEDNKYRFSSKEFHAATGFYYYGYRFYAPNLQRWLNRDPIEEKGGVNLYGFVHNSPLNGFDALGMRLTCIKWEPYWEAEGYSSADECALKEYHELSVDEPGWFIIGLPISWGCAIYDYALWKRVESMCKKQVCVKWR
jgi:RHS repeat-associated protein